MPAYQLAIALLTGRPYAGVAFQALQGDPERQRCFRPVAEILAAEQTAPIRVLEIGSWAGVSTLSWAAAVRATGREIRLTCVDFWRPYFDLDIDRQTVYQEMNAVSESGLITGLFHHNLQVAGLLEQADIRCGDARAILPNLPDRSFDVVYVDGGHSAEDVDGDITQARRLIRPGGIIAGDDLELPWNDSLGEEHGSLVAGGQDYAYSSKHELWYHPGVTEGVARHFPQVFSWRGFWAVKAEGTEWLVPQIHPERYDLPAHIVDSRRLEEVRHLARIGRWTFLSVHDRVIAAGDPSIAAIAACIDLGAMNSGNLVIGASLKDTIAAVSEVDSVPQRPVAAPELLGEYVGYNIIRLAEGYLALDRSLGTLDIDVSGEEILRRLGFTRAAFGRSLNDVLLQLDLRRILTSLPDQQAVLMNSVATVRSEVEQASDAILAHIDLSQRHLECELRVKEQDLRGEIDKVADAARNVAVALDAAQSRIQSDFALKEHDLRREIEEAADAARRATTAADTARGSLQSDLAVMEHDLREEIKKIAEDAREAAAAIDGVQTRLQSELAMKDHDLRCEIKKVADDVRQAAVALERAVMKLKLGS